MNLKFQIIEMFQETKIRVNLDTSEGHRTEKT